MGGAVKRMADRIVRNGKDLPTASDVYQALLPETSIQLYYVNDESIETINAILPRKPQTIKGTMKIHQLICTHTKEIKFRDVS